MLLSDLKHRGASAEHTTSLSGSANIHQITSQVLEPALLAYWVKPC